MFLSPFSLKRIYALSRTIYNLKNPTPEEEKNCGRSVAGGLRISRLDCSNTNITLIKLMNKRNLKVLLNVSSIIDIRDLRNPKHFAITKFKRFKDVDINAS